MASLTRLLLAGCTPLIVLVPSLYCEIWPISVHPYYFSYSVRQKYRNFQKFRRTLNHARAHIRYAIYTCPWTPLHFPFIRCLSKSIIFHFIASISQWRQRLWEKGGRRGKAKKDKVIARSSYLQEKTRQNSSEFSSKWRHFIYPKNVCTHAWLVASYYKSWSKIDLLFYMR